MTKSSVEISASPSVSLATSVPYIGMQSSQSASNSMSLSLSSGQDSQSLLMSTPSSSVQPSQSLFMSMTKSSVEISASPSVSFATSVSYVGMQSSQTTSNSLSLGLSSVQDSQSLLMSSTVTQTMAMQQSSDSSVNIAPSPSQSPAVMSTSIVLVSAEASDVYAAEVRIEQEFTDDLNNQTSLAFMELAFRVVAYMTEVYSSIRGFIRVEVISFTSGSVVADTRVIFERNSNVTTENITNSLQTANITGNNSLEIIEVKVTRIESVPSSSATSIVMANSSTQIVPSQSLSSPIQQSISPSTYNPPSLNTSVNVLVPTSPLPTTIVPASGVRIFLVELTLEGVFNNNLANSSSPEFINLKLQVIEFLNGLYNGSLGFIMVNRTSFSNGSIVANSDVLFNETESIVTSLQLQTLIADAIRENRTGMLNILRFRVTEKGVGGLDDDGLETWIIVLIVCFSFAFLILVAVSLMVSKIFLYTNCTDSARNCRHHVKKKFDIL